MPTVTGCKPHQEKFFLERRFVKEKSFQLPKLHQKNPFARPEPASGSPVVRNNPLKYTDPTGHYSFPGEPGDPDYTPADWNRDNAEAQKEKIEKELKTDKDPKEANVITETTESKTNPFTGAAVPENQNTIEAKPGVDLSRLEPEITSKFGDIKDVFKEHNAPDPVITDAYQSIKHQKDSKHYSNEAIDLRGNNVSDDKLRDMAEDLQGRVGPDYYVGPEFFPKEPRRDHIHFEYDPKWKKETN